MKTQLTLLAAASAFAGFASSASAQLIGYESFQNPTIGAAVTATGYADDKPFGTSLGGGNGLPIASGGTGFRNGTANATGATIAAGLTYGSLATSNNALAYNANSFSSFSHAPYRFQTGDAYTAYRIGGTNGGNFGIDASGTAYDLYVSFLFKVSDVTKTERVVLNASSGSGVYLGLNGTNGQFTVAGNALGTAAISNPTPVSLTNDATYLVVGRYSFTQTSSNFSYWLNPTIGGSLGTPNGTITGTGVASTAANNVAATAFSGWNVRGDGLATLTADEFRYGLSYADVTPVSAVPEPSSAAVLAGLGALGLVGVRRRRCRA